MIGLANFASDSLSTFVMKAALHESYCILFTYYLAATV